MATPTLAAKLGTTTHLSPLLRKAERLGLTAEGLERLAIQRGCDYYNPDGPLPPPAISVEQFSNAELAIALLNPALRYDPHTLRLGAAMLSTEGQFLRVNHQQRVVAGRHTSTSATSCN